MMVSLPVVSGLMMVSSFPHGTLNVARAVRVVVALSSRTSTPPVGRMSGVHQYFVVCGWVVVVVDWAQIWRWYTPPSSCMPIRAGLSLAADCAASSDVGTRSGRVACYVDGWVLRLSITDMSLAV